MGVLTLILNYICKIIMETSISIANFFIKKSLEDSIPISPMKVIKLVYISHGWHLGITGLPLFEEDIQAWKFGPVIKTLYHSMSRYGNSPVTNLLTEFRTTEVGIQVLSPEVNSVIDPFLNKIWSVYKSMTAVQLSSLTHKEGSPWDTAWNMMNGKHIPDFHITNDIIKRHYAIIADSNKQPKEHA